MKMKKTIDRVMDRLIEKSGITIEQRDAIRREFEEQEKNRRREWKREQGRREKPRCPSCGAKMRRVGSINKPDMNFVAFGSTYYTDGLFQCVKCKDVYINPWRIENT